MTRTIVLALGMLAMNAAGCGTPEHRPREPAPAVPNDTSAYPADENIGPETARAVGKWIAALQSDNPHRFVPAVKELVKTGKGALPALVRALESGNPNVRAGATEALGEIGDRAATAPLVRALEDPDWTVRYYAVHALEALEDPGAVDPLIEALKDGDRLIRDHAARALGRIADPRAVGALIGALKGDDVLAYEPAEEALIKIGKPSAGPLVLALRGSHVIARRFATHVLGEIGGDEEIEPLIEALKDSDDSVRWGAAVALGKIGDRRTVAPLIELLRDRDFEPRIEVREALKKITGLDFGNDPGPWSDWWGDAKASGWVAPRRGEDLPDGAGEKLGVKSGKARAGTPEPGRVRELVSNLASEDPRIYVNAVNALVQIGPPAVIPLVDALRHGNHLVRRHAAWALGKLGDARAVATLIETLKDEDPVVRASGAGALGRMRETRAVDRIVSLLSDPEEETVHAAATALGDIGGAAAVGALIEAMRKPDEELRYAAVTALAVMDPPPVEELAGLLVDEDGELRLMVLEALGEMADKRAARWAIPLLKDEDEEIRAEAVRALQQIEDRRAVEPLLGLLNDPSVAVRRSAVNALGSFHDPRAVGPLVSALADDAVREEAVDALKALTGLDLGKEEEPWRRWFEAEGAVREQGGK